MQSLESYVEKWWIRGPGDLNIPKLYGLRPDNSAYFIPPSRLVSVFLTPW